MKVSLLIITKIPAIVSIFVFISRENFKLSSWNFDIFVIIIRENFMLSGVEHENFFITSGPEVASWNQMLP